MAVSFTVRCMSLACERSPAAEHDLHWIETNFNSSGVPQWFLQIRNSSSLIDSATFIEVKLVFRRPSFVVVVENSLEDASRRALALARARRRRDYLPLTLTTGSTHVMKLHNVKGTPTTRRV